MSAPRTAASSRHGHGARAAAAVGRALRMKARACNACGAPYSRGYGPPDPRRVRPSALRPRADPLRRGRGTVHRRPARDRLRARRRPRAGPFSRPDASLRARRGRRQPRPGRLGRTARDPGRARGRGRLRRRAPVARGLGRRSFAPGRRGPPGGAAERRPRDRARRPTRFDRRAPDPWRPEPDRGRPPGLGFQRRRCADDRRRLRRHRGGSRGASRRARSRVRGPVPDCVC